MSHARAGPRAGGPGVRRRGGGAPGQGKSQRNGNQHPPGQHQPRLRSPVANSGGSLATYLVVMPPNAHDHATLQFSSAMAIRIRGGNLHVTAMASHTPHP